MDEHEDTRPHRPNGEHHGHGGDGEETGEPYEYTPLPEPESAESGHDPLAPKTFWTRLLTIHPGEYDDEIAVDLHDVALEAVAGSQLPGYRVSAAPHLEQYEALSYAWGSSEDPSHVVVGEEGRTISITRNLDLAMRHLRHADRPRVMWIDALCIDQTSSSDKSRQDGYTHLIYRSSPRVVVWLGQEADDSDHAMDVIGSVGEKVRIAWDRDEINWVTDEDEAIWGSSRSLNELPLDERDWAAVKSLIKRPWFSGTWVRQEVFSERDEDEVYCGESCVSLDAFRRGLYCLTSRMPSGESSDGSLWDDCRIALCGDCYSGGQGFSSQDVSRDVYQEDIPHQACVTYVCATYD